MLKFNTLYIIASIYCWIYTIEAAKVRVDSMKHDIGLVTAQTWDAKVSKFRDSSVFTVLYFTQDCKECQNVIDTEYNKFGSKMKGIVNILAVDCTENLKLCKNEQIDIKKLPMVKVYPQFPLPPFIHTGTIDLNSLSKVVKPLIPSSITSVVDEKELEKIISTDLTIPKVLFFSDKATSAPLLVKAISNAFKDKLQVMFLPKDQYPEATMKYLRNKKFPGLVVVRKGKKDEVYNGNFEFQPVFDWLNVFSETFVKGGGYAESTSVQSDPEKEPWKFESIPELTIRSHIDICFKKTIKHLCVIYIKKGSTLSEQEKEVLESLKDHYINSNSGPDFKFMWMNADIELDYINIFEIKEIPNIVVLNTHKKVRYTKLDDADGSEIKAPQVRKLLSRITAGEARYKVIPQSKLPKFAKRPELEGSDVKDEL